MAGLETVGFSYGIGKRDLWSEAMSNVFHVPTRLYDCSIPLGLSPTMAGRVPNGTESGGCRGAGHPCYEVAYQAFRVCLVPETIHPGRLESLSVHLRGRGPLSAHVKISAEGGEWPVLQQLLHCDTTLDKIRTLHLDLNFQDEVKNGAVLTERESLERQVQIFEKLLERFRVAGSTLESRRQAWRPEHDCRRHQCEEPSVHTASGFGLTRFSISLVHRDLVGPDPGTKPLAPEVTGRCHSAEHSPQNCRIGVPCIPPVSIWPYSTQTSWRSGLGDRILAALLPGVLQRDCGDFKTYDNQAWCLRAMKQQKSVGLSYGIEARDPWSETLSNDFGVPVKLYDCFVNPRASALMSGTAPNGTQRCSNAEIPCYKVPYQAFPICLRAETDVPAAAGGPRYETLAQHLEGQGILSAHVKLSIEGSEWPVLQELLACQAQMDKIRTLHLEVHMGQASELEAQLPERERLERRVRMLERMRDIFRVVGSTLEHSRQGWHPETDCPQQTCPEPVVHTTGGFGLERFVVSYVHRDLVPTAGVERVAPASPGPAVAGRVDGAPQMKLVDPLATPTSQLSRPSSAPSPLAKSLLSRGTPSSGCLYSLGDGSRTGKPCLPPVRTWPFKTNTSWRVALGERVVAAATPSITSDDCGGFRLFDDQAWCLRAMKGEALLGLSYGIGRRDHWSEKLSNIFSVPTRLYDCNVPAGLSLLASPAKNGTGHCGMASKPCYEVPYQAFRVCLGSDQAESEGRRTEPLSLHLSRRGPLSTHVKMDAHGAEWDVLEQFLASSSDQGKVRTLNVKFHIGFHLDTESRFTEQELLERQVSIMERLRKRFRPVGSTLEYFREGWHPEEDCPRLDCKEPTLHTAGGFGLHQFAVSYVHADLVPSRVRRVAPQLEQLRHGADEPSAAAGPQQHPPPPASDPPCQYAVAAAQMARTGVPCIPPAAVWPYGTNTDTPWRSQLGERIRRAARPGLSSQDCDGFKAADDHVWCMKAMGVKRSVALSYGVGARDVWSEQMSNDFWVPASLYDCLADPSHSTPMAGRAQNGTGSCVGAREACYAVPYHAFRICVGPAPDDPAGRRYEPLDMHLGGRGRHSVYLKLSIEGAEWRVLERLLDNEVDQDKLITLDVEFHFGFSGSASESESRLGEQERLERQVRTFERLRDRFSVIGSTIESLRQGWRPESNCPKHDCPEPPVHTAGGFGLERFTVSYVHRALVLPSDLGAGPLEGRP